MTAISKMSTLVSTNWLKERVCTLSTPRGAQKLGYSLQILDTSFIPEDGIDGYKTCYKEAHIPTALHFNLEKITPRVEGSHVRFPIPDSNVFQDYVEDLGISNHTHVIAYDRFNSRPSFRTWFLFRLFGHDKISVLNGGLRKWLLDGYHVNTDEPTVEKGTFEVNFQSQLLRKYEDILKNLDTKKEQIMDARGRKMFYYSSEDDKGGHIPSAKNIPFGSLFREDGTFKSELGLKQLFDEAGVDLNKPVVASCLTGLTACGLIAAAHLLGHQHVPIYNGSFTEWNALADVSKIARVEKP